jgi:hypothetical protein
VDQVPGGWNRIQVEGGPGTRRVERDTGRGWNWIQVEGGTGTRRVEWDTGRGWT